MASTIHQSLNAGTTAPQQQPLPLPSSKVHSILLTSEANVGDTGVLLPLVLSFYKYHDRATNAIMLLSTVGPGQTPPMMSFNKKRGL